MSLTSRLLTTSSILTWNKYKKEFAKFKPFLLAIIENVMHMRKEMRKRKELYDIGLNLPLGIKLLIEYMPFIFEFIKESIHNKDENVAIETLTHWIRIISNFNDIIDPSLSEFTADLFEAFCNNYQTKSSNYGSMSWIITKLGPKTRIYKNDKIILNKKDTWNCLKIIFKNKPLNDKNSKLCNTYTWSLDHTLRNETWFYFTLIQPTNTLSTLKLSWSSSFLDCSSLSIQIRWTQSDTRVALKTCQQAQQMKIFSVKLINQEFTQKGFHTTPMKIQRHLDKSN